MQMQSTYWLEEVLKMISLYVNALLCTLQHIIIHAMQLSGVNSENCTESETYAHVGLWDGGPVFREPPCIRDRVLFIVNLIHTNTTPVHCTFVYYYFLRYFRSFVRPSWVRGYKYIKESCALFYSTPFLYVHVSSTCWRSNERSKHSV